VGGGGGATNPPARQVASKSAERRNQLAGSASGKGSKGKKKTEREEGCNAEAVGRYLAGIGAVEGGLRADLEEEARRGASLGALPPHCPRRVI
jgi:hypothetical protein